MSRSRKKIQSSDQDDKVSIFDSEDDAPNVQRGGSAVKERQVKGAEKVVPRGRKVAGRAREKKLSRDEESIMRTLLGQENKQKEQLPPKEPALPSSTPIPPLSHPLSQPLPHSRPLDIQPAAIPNANTFASKHLSLQDLRIQDCELSWLDLQQCIDVQANDTVRQVPHVAHSTSHSQSNYNSNYQRNQISQPRRPYQLNYTKRNVRRFANPRQPNRNQNTRRSRYATNYQPYYGYNYPRGYHSNYPTYNQPDRYQMGHYGYQPTNRMSRYDQYPPYHGYSSNQYAAKPSKKIVTELQETQNPYSQGQQNDDIYDGIVGYNIINEQKQVQQQSTEAKVEEQQKKAELSKEESQERRRKILEDIAKLKEQFIKLEDEEENKVEQGELPASMQRQQAKASTSLWQFQPLPEPAKYPAPNKEASDSKYQKSKTDGRIAMIELILKQNPFLTQFQMAQVLKVLDPFLNARIERSVVLRLLKMSGYKKKKIIFLPKQRNSPSNLNFRKQYALHYKSLLAQNYSLAYYDELIINQYFDKQSGWCKQEEQIEMRPQKFISRSLTVLALLTKDGACVWEARFGEILEQDFAKILSKMLKKAGEGKSKRQLIANPLKYRRADHFQQIARRRGWQVSILPRQSLYLNPLQFYFAEVKDKLKRKKFQTLQGLFSETVQTLQQCDKERTGERVVGKIDVFIEKAMIRQNF